MFFTVCLFLLPLQPNLLKPTTMAIVTIPLLGRAKKSAGEMTFTKWKNKNVLKNKASNVANPNTVNQQMRRGMFATLIQYGRYLLPVADLGFVAYRNVMSQFNAFVKFNYGSLVVAGTAPAYSINESALVIAVGPLTPTAISTLAGTNGSATVTFTWPTSTTAPDQAASDKVRLVVLNTTAGESGYNIGSTLRSAGTATVTLNAAAVTGDVLEGFMFFSRDDNSMASDSSNLQATV